MARNSNTSSLENLNGSGYSVQSAHTYLSLGPTHTTTSRATTPVHRSLNRNHSYPALVAREYHYADNSAVGHNMYYSNRTVVQSAATYQEPASDSYANQGPSRSQAYLLPTATYSEEAYDHELDLGDDHTDDAMLASSSEQHRSYIGQQTPRENHQYPRDLTYRNTPSNSDYWREDDQSHPSQPNSDEDEDQYYIGQSSTPLRQETYNVRPQSPTTQRYLQEVSPHDRMRLGLFPRYENVEEEQRAYEPATRYGTSSHHGSSRNRSTRRH